VDDDALLRRTAHGDEEAFRLLVERWQGPVYRFLARMLASPEEARDAAQETFVRVFRHAPRYRAGGQFRAWLFRIAGNLARSALRRRKLLGWVPFDLARHDRPAVGEDALEQLARDERRRAVRRALARLPQRQRQAVLLRRYEGMTQQEIAAALQTTEAAVESLLQRARRQLARALRDEGRTS